MRDEKDRGHTRDWRRREVPPRQRGPLTPQFGTYGLQTEEGGCSLSPKLVALLGQC